jgi:ribonucleoside-diphosphate reductase beta chain
MPSLLDLTVQGDVATIADESQLPQIKLMEPLELYRLWERQNWVSHAIDFTQDRWDWESMDEEERDSMLWGLSAFFVGEERVTNQFSGLVLAAEDKNEEAFLLTQQVDEARHAQHFNGLFEEVMRFDGSFEDRLEEARQDLN